MIILNRNKIQLLFFFQIIFQLQILFSYSQLLNRIIRLADNPYRYNHFSFNSDGDMIIDIESYPVTKIRKFFGVTKNGKEYFTDSKGKKTHFSSMSFSYDNGRVEGESCFIKVQSTNPNSLGKEFLFGVSKSESNTYKTEVYDFKDNFAYNFGTNEFFGELTCNVFSIIPDPLNTNTEFNYYISYVGYETRNNYKLFTRKMSFYLNSNTNKGINNLKLAEIDAINQKIITCFFTDSYLYACFFTNKDSQLTLWVYNPKSKTNTNNLIHTFTDNYDRRFYKVIHLKEDIGFLAYFKDSGYIPTFSIFQIELDKKIKAYKTYSDIQTKKGTFYNIDMLCDLIK